MDDYRNEPIADRIGRDFTGAMSLFVLLLGHRLGLLAVLAKRGPLTAAELAGATGYDERYLAEWLAAMAAGGYVACDADAGRFWLTPEQAAVYVDVESPAYAMPFLVWAPRLAGALPALEEAFRTGGGVPYEAYEPAGGDGTGNSNRVESSPTWRRGCAPVPDVWQRVARGARRAGHRLRPRLVEHCAGARAAGSDDRWGGRRSGVAGRGGEKCDGRRAGGTHPLSPGRRRRSWRCRSATISSPRWNACTTWPSRWRPCAACAIARTGRHRAHRRRAHGRHAGRKPDAARPPQLRLERAALPAAGAPRSRLGGDGLRHGAGA